LITRLRFLGFAVTLSITRRRALAVASAATAQRRSVMHRIARVVVLMFTLVGVPLGAQTYPVMPVRIIVPFAPGGGTDIMARLIAQHLTASFGNSFFVENKPGAGGLIGIETGVKAAPDGYTLLLVSSSYSVNPALYKLNFDPVSDIAAIIQISQSPLLLVANPQLHVNSLRDLIAMAKQRPGGITFASAGPGSITHVGMELICLRADIKMTHVPYKGTGPALIDTIAGRADVFLSSPLALLPHVKAGRLRALAVTSPRRAAVLPEVPTAEESGLPGLETTLWYGLIGPKGMPRRIVERLNADISMLLTKKEMIEQLHSELATPAGGTPEEFLEQIRSDVALWHKVVAESGIRVE
jgi:tripartite-type tricarboxylate transporter receptor subunit TctC